MTQDMKTILTRMFTVALLMMVSLGAKADVKVLFGEKGTEKFEGKGGSIKIEQADSKVDKTKVTVYLTFIPQSGYAFDEKSLGVYAVVSTSTASTRAPEISGDPLKLTEEKTDVPSAKRYSVDIDSKLALWVKEANFDKKQEDSKGNRSLSTDYGYSGTYYIASDYQTPNTTTRNYDPNPTTLTNNYYLCPTENWISFGSTGETKDTWTTGDDNPFLTTYKARLHANDPAPDTYDLTKAKWTIEYYTTVSGKDYYYFKHGSGKYMVLNKQIDGMKGGSPENRIRVHLEELTPEQLADETTRNMALFTITQDNRSIFICPKNQSSVHLTVNNGNNDHPYGYGNKKGTIVSGSTTYGMEGTIGIYGNSNTDDNKYLYLEDYITRPTITYNEANDEVTITAVQTGVDLIYTTDGTTPSTTNPNATSITGTVGNPTTVTFHPSDGETTIKAVAVVNGELSNVAKFITPVFFGSQHKYLIQSQNDPWNTTDFHFYMIPGDEDANSILKVNTTSLFRPTMEWYFVSAGMENGVQYYYIVNYSNGKYLCYDSTNKIFMDEFSSNDKFKFIIEESPKAGTFNIRPYGLNTGDRFLNKNSNNSSDNPINLANSNSGGNLDNTSWKFVLPSSLDKNAPFTQTSFYKINSFGSSGYYIVPPSGNNTYATTSNSSDVNVVKTGAWYFEDAQSADASDWLTYYHIRNAETGKYLYFDKDANNAGACLVMKEAIESGNEDRYLFTWARTATENTYYIVPKLLKDKSLNQISSLQRNNGILQSNLTRSAGNYAWTFTVTTETFNCEAPVITYSTEQNGFVISSTTLGAKIYYTTDDNPNTLDWTEYNTGAIPTPLSPTTIKAIAARFIDHSDKSAVAEFLVTQVDMPEFDYSAGNSISITCATSGAEIHYTIDGSTPTASSPLYTGPLFEGIVGKTISAIAVKPGSVSSAIATSETIVLSCATPVIKRGSDNASFTIECSFPTSGVTIKYTTATDSGTPADPLTGSSYTGEAVSCTFPITIRAIAIAEGYENSEEATRTIDEGLAEEDGVYLISSDGDFVTFVEMVLNNENGEAAAHYKLMTDVSASGVDPITNFTGSFDGGMNTISNLGHALFNTVTDGVVKNVILDNVGISGGENVGAICNEATGASRIYNCGVLATSSTVEKDEDGYDHMASSSSTITGSGNVGSIVGLLDGSSRVINCFSYADVSGGTHVGGIVGYNNVATTASNLKTMVMNCMFYGEVSGSSIAPIYNGLIITNDGDADGVNNFNYFRLESSYIKNTKITKVYNCALGAETRFLQRFEFFRYLLNSNRELAAWWATGDADNKDEMMKWVMEPTQIGSTTPYPILKNPDKYASVVNYTPSTIAYDEANRNQGLKLTNEGDHGVLHVTIQMGSGSAVYAAPSGAGLKSGVTGSFDLTITDKDFEHFNFNYGKVQLPYYNDYCDGNYTGYRVVTGWKIVSITGGTTGSYSIGDDVTYTNGKLTSTPYNFADRKCTNKDLYSVSGRVFNQGAYWDVPEGVTAITIEPYWGKAVYLADAYWDVVYKNGSGNGTGAGTAYDAMTTAANVLNVGGGEGVRYNNSSTFNDQVVFTSIGDAISTNNNGLFKGVSGSTGHTVYDYAVVLVGNYHNNYSSSNPEASETKPYTVTSVDKDGDNEPDYSFMMRFNGRIGFHPVRYDFLNLIGLGMAQKTTGGVGSYNLGILQPKYWFEVTNTALFRVTQFEYSPSNRVKKPIILQGGVIEQWVTQQNDAGDRVSYFHVGGNVWFKEFHRGSHQDNKDMSTPHPPVSVTGGDYNKFYLTGYYQSKAAIYDDNAECYINGGRFGEVAGAGMEGIGASGGNNGNITWIIDNADIKNFYGGGINFDNPVNGNIHTIISNSHVELFCGGPKFGDMESERTVTTTATNCTFGTYFGAGYGGNSYNRIAPRNHNNIINFPHNDKQAGNHDSWNAWLAAYYKQNYGNGGVSTQFDYQFLPMSSNTENVARIFVDYVAFSLATTHNVTSSLTGCTITGNFYGGGSLGKVEGDVTSTLTDCTVNGSVFGAGYSASLPTVEVMDIGFATEPYYYEDLGTYRMGVFPTPTTTYHWEHVTAAEFNNKQVDNNEHILYTTADLTALGTVTGTVKLTIDGSTTVVGESVYGGGEESSVNRNTEVVVNDGTIGVIPAGQTGGATYGNVYGGGKGKYKENKIVNGVEAEVELEASKAVTLGLVKGNTNVTINGGSIMHNVYGGGAFGSVGEFDYDATTGMPTARKANTTGGTANVTILGGTIGTNGDENGMVFGSSRGDVGAPGEIHDKLAWVYDTHVVIGTTGQGTDAPQPQIKGSVYGSGENGHTYQNTIVDVHSGTIGIASGSTITTNDNGTPEDTSDDTTYSGAAYPYRGNVYGGGCGTDKYASVVNGTKDTYNPLAGIVYGTTTVNIDGGLVVHNVYGAGAMGSVGKMTTTTSDNTSTTTFISGGTTTIEISGGTVGVSGTVGDGNVFGAARGDAATTQTDVALVKSTGVTISGTTTGTNIWGSVYGGGETGDVGTYTTDADGYNIYPDGTGDCTVSISGGTIHHHVFGAGKGTANTFECPKAMVSTASVIISNGVVNGNVYGGGEIGRVENNTAVTVGLEKVADGTSTYCTSNDGTDEGSVLAEGTPVVGKYLRSGDAELYTYTLIEASAPEVKGSVFGAGAGKATHGYSALVRGNPSVTIQGNAKVRKNVYGGGEIATAGRYKVEDDLPTERLRGGDCTVIIQGKAEIGPESTSATDDEGNVFGACKGVVPQYSADFKKMNHNNGWDSFATVDKYLEFLGTLALATDTRVTISDDVKIKGSVYGGGERGIVKQDVTVDILGGTISKDVYGGGSLADTQTNNWNTADNTWADGKKTDGTTLYKTTVNLKGGTINGDAYGGGLGQKERAEDAEHNITALDDIKAYVWGDVKVELNNNNNGETADGTQKGCIVSRIFGCNNQNGTPKGKVQVYVYATQNKNKPDNSETQIINAKFPLHDGAETGATSTYDVAAVYGGGNLSPYEPADDDGKTEVYIYGCDLTSIKQVYGGGNAACAPATLVHVTGAYEIEELFGGGNGYDDYELYDKYYKNPGANVGYKNYSVLDDTGNGSQGDPYGCKDADGTSTLDGRSSYAYGTGIATTEIIGGKIHYVYGGSNKKGNIRVSAKSVYEELDEDCPIVTDETYGGGKDSPMDGMVDMGLGCVNNMEQTFGGSKNADVNSDIYLRITNGTYKKVFGGNNTSGAINGSITVEIKEEGCSPVRIEELYLGGYLAPYSVYGYETDGDGNYIKDVYVDENGNNLYDDNGEIIKQPRPLTSGSSPKKDPRIYVISATRIDNIFGGGYKATVVGNPHINVNMEKGKIDKKYNTSNNPVAEGLHQDTQNPKRPYYDYTVETSVPGNDAILAIGTIGTIYGGGNMANIIGNTSVEIGMGYWHQKNTNDVLETIGTDGVTYTYDETNKVWSGQKTTGEGDSQTTETVTLDKAPVPARNAATITGNVFGGGKGVADTYECEKAMVGVPDGQDESIGNTSVIIANGTVGPVDSDNKVGRQVDANGVVIGGNVYGGGEVGRVEYNTNVTIGLDPAEIAWTSAPVIGGDVFGAGAGVETHGYSALVRGDADVTVQASAKVNGTVYGGGEIATVGKYWVKGVDYPSTLTPPDPPSDDILSDFMPYAPRSGGVCTVTLQDNAEIGDGTTGGHVFGAGKGVEPNWVYGNSTIDKKYWSRRMSKYDPADYKNEDKIGEANEGTWEYIKEYSAAELADENIEKYVWEYFDTEAKYTTFLETLALASETHVTIGEASGSEKVTVNGSVYGGSENGFVQTDTDVDILGTCEIGANVFGGGKGTEKHDAAGRVKGNSNVDISGGTIADNVYGGGELGHVGTFTEIDGKYVMQQIIGKNGNNINTGLCSVTITGGKVGPDNNTDTEKGNVFGAGKGKDDTFKCEKAMTMNTNVSISDGTVNGNVYGGGEIGRVENDTEVTIGRKSTETEGNGTGTPTINGSVFGAGRGVATHGYSALVRGNTQVTVEGAQGSTVAESVYGGGEIASVGRYGLDAAKMPEILVDGGICTVKILGYATIGPANAEDDEGNVFGAGKGVDPQTFNNTGNDKSKLSRRMTVYNADDFPDDNGIPTTTSTGSTWEYYETGSPYVWEYYQSASAYSTYLETLALATQPHVIIGGNATVNGSVFGGGELGLTKGSVYVNILSGTIVKDVYGGGSLANTNTTSTWSLRDDEGKPEPPVNGVYTVDPTLVHPTTTVNLLGGKLRNAYGGGLGQPERAADAANNITALADIPAKVFGNVKVNLNGLEKEDYDENIHQNYVQAYKETAESDVSYYELKNTRNSSGLITSYATGAIVEEVFGCNNLNGSPQKHVKVHVFATQNADAGHNTIGSKYVPTEENGVTSSVYDVKAVYGGGNLAPYEPEGGAATTESTEVIVEGCDLSSIKQVYGGGNAASTPATNVTINSAYEIEEVFGGGNGEAPFKLYDKTYLNPGANVGYKNYTHYAPGDDGKGSGTSDDPYQPVDDANVETKEKRLASSYVYGTGEASVNIYGGRIHRVFGGSNTKGNVRVTAVTVLDNEDPCDLIIDEAYGGGKSAPMDAEAKLMMACIPGLKAVYGGAQDADIQDDVVLTITNGTFNRVFGGNNVSGQIHGTITVNIEETGCKPVVIGQLYGGGNQAPYTAPWKDENDHSKGRKDGPTVNVKSFTSIGEVFGGGYGETAVVTGDTYVNVNVCKGKFASSEYTENTKTFSFSEYKRNKDGVGEESFMHNSETGERIVENKDISVLLPGHKANEIGAIKNVFGGGNAAKVVGNTNVNIGTEAGEEVYAEVDVTTGSSVVGYCTRTGKGTNDDPYVYSEPLTEGTAVAGTTYYQKTVKGADIRGNVYGGGNNAGVTGDTNVTIGKKATP